MTTPARSRGSSRRPGPTVRHPPPRWWRGLVRVARPRQWIKNLLVFVAPAAAGVLHHRSVFLDALAAFGIFCVAASGTYFLNDSLDADADRAHPTKRFRPIAAGVVSERLGLVIGVVLLVASFFLGLAGGRLAAGAGDGHLRAHQHLLLAWASRTSPSSTWPACQLGLRPPGHRRRRGHPGAPLHLVPHRGLLRLPPHRHRQAVRGEAAAGRARRPTRPASARRWGMYSVSFLQAVRTLSAAVTVTAYCLWAFERAAQVHPGHAPDLDPADHRPLRHRPPPRRPAARLRGRGRPRGAGHPRPPAPDLRRGLGGPVRHRDLRMTDGPDGRRQLLTGWGRTAPSAAEVVHAVHTDLVDQAMAAAVAGAGAGRGLVARGLGRSYGDAAQNAGGVVVDATWLDAVHRVDLDHGLITVGAGISLETLMERFVPLGWFVPVTPGTRQVTVGGAIAADIHGKNHHRDGAFCSHVTRMTLVTPTGTVELTPDVRPRPVLGHRRRHGPDRGGHRRHPPDDPGGAELPAGRHRAGRRPRRRDGQDADRRRRLPLLGGLDRLPVPGATTGSLGPHPGRPRPPRRPPGPAAVAPGPGPGLRAPHPGAGARSPRPAACSTRSPSGRSTSSGSGRRRGTSWASPTT